MFDTIKTLYKKNSLKEKYETFELLWVLSILIQDQNIGNILKKIIPLIFKSDPTKIIYILYAMIPKKQYVPKFCYKKFKKEEPSDLMKNLTKYFNWSNKESKMYRELIEGES